MFQFLVSYTMLYLGASAYASAVVPRTPPSAGEKFGLYAYGESFGGLSLFYGDGKLLYSPTTILRHTDEVIGKALIGDPANSTASTTSSVYC